LSNAHLHVQRKIKKRKKKGGGRKKRGEVCGRGGLLEEEVKQGGED